MIRLGLGFVLLLVALPVCEASAAVSIPLTVTLSEVVTVTGTPQIAVDVGGASRFATYSGGTGTNTLTFTLSPQIGDVDLDGVTVSSPILLNGGTIKDGAGNNATLTFTPPNTSGIKVDYPSLGLNFIADSDGRFTLNGTVYNDFPSLLSAAGGSFTRASIGTYFDSAGTLQTASAGIPRFDYDPVTHVAKGLLLEESRTNYSFPSGQVNGFYFYANAVSSGIVAPDGSSIAEVNTFDQASGSRIFRDYNPGLGNKTYSISVWVKGYAGSTITQTQLRIKDYQTDTIRDQSSWTNISTANWTRLTATGTTAGITPGIRFEIGVNTFGSSAKMLIWGNQTEQGAFPTSYIPTTAAAVTRSADNISIPVGSWFNASAGSISMAADLYLSGATAIQQGITIHGGTNQGYLFYKQASSSNIYAFAGTAQSNLGTVSSNTPFKIGMTYEASAAIGSLNGSLGGSISPTSVTTPTALDISSNPTGQWNGHLSSYKFYPLRATNAQLQLLTQ